MRQDTFRFGPCIAIVVGIAWNCMATVSPATDERTPVPKSINILFEGSCLGHKVTISGKTATIQETCCGTRTFPATVSRSLRSSGYSYIEFVGTFPTFITVHLTGRDAGTYTSFNGFSFPFEGRWFEVPEGQCSLDEAQ
jgi:hypothetical protein